MENIQWKEVEKLTVRKGSCKTMAEKRIVNIGRVAALLCGLFGATTGVQASDIKYGVGGAFSSDNRAIYFPLIIGEFSIEPAISSSKSDFPIGEGRKVETTRESYTVGLFKHQKLRERIFSYYGARIGVNSYDYYVDYGNQRYETDADGTLFSPTYGIQYEVLEGLSLALDLSIIFTKTDYDEYEYFEPTGETAYQDSGRSRTTNKEFIIRYIF